MPTHQILTSHTPQDLVYLKATRIPCPSILQGPILVMKSLYQSRNHLYQQPVEGSDEQQQPDQHSGQEQEGDFLLWLLKFCLALGVYELCLRRDDWDTLQALRLLALEDMQQLNILDGPSCPPR